MNVMREAVTTKWSFQIIADGAWRPAMLLPAVGTTRLCFRTIGGAW